MKKSRYNFIRQIDNQSVLYNAQTEAIAILNPEVAQLYNEHSVDDLRHLHPDFFRFLCDKKYLLDDDCDEPLAQLKRWQTVDEDPRYFSVTVNSTLNCNLCCWYCYENHTGKLNMTTEVMERVKKLISRQLSQPGLECFYLNFFGGEPLLNFDNVAKTLLDYVNTESKRYGKKVILSFVTNGVLLTKEILYYLNSLGFPVYFQITLDGNEDIHNSIRHTKTNGPTYRTILKNAARILEYPEMYLVMRCNFTSASLPAFIDVASDLEAWKSDPSLYHDNLTVDLHQVWQDCSNTDMTDIKSMERNVREAFAFAQLHVTPVKRANRYRCYADRKNSLVVNYNGDVFRCTARDFITEKREGILLPDGSVEWNERSQLRDSVKWNNPVCLKCNIYPLCCGMCSQNKLENPHGGRCDYGYSEIDKDEIIQERIQWLLMQATKNNIISNK